jgi:hypothetical protein
MVHISIRMTDENYENSLTCNVSVLSLKRQWHKTGDFFVISHTLSFAVYTLLIFAYKLFALNYQYMNWPQCGNSQEDEQKSCDEKGGKPQISRWKFSKRLLLVKVHERTMIYL